MTTGKPISASGQFDNTLPNIVLITDSNENAPVGRMLGIARITQELRDAGFQVAVIYYAALFDYDEICNILKQLISPQTLFVGISNWLYATYPMINNEPRMLPCGSHNKDFQQFVRQLNPSCRLVLGGPSGADVSSNKYFDYVVLGYAEISVVNLARHLCYGDTLNKSYKSLHGFTVINDSRAEGFDVASSRTQYLSHDVVLPGETLSLEVGRGCIFQCAFCGFPMNGKKKFDYLRDFDVLRQELIDNYEQHAVTNYMFSDDTFNDSLEKIHLINAVSKSLPFKLTYWAYIRLDLLIAHPGSVDLLYESGLRSAFFGIESWNPATGKIVGKKADCSAHIDMIKYIKQTYGDDFYTTASFIVGLPEETMESMNHTIKVLTSDECLLDYVHMGALSIRRKEASSNGFISKIQANPEHYGYREVDQVTTGYEPGHGLSGKDSDYLLWANDHMDWRQAQDLADQFVEQYPISKGWNRRHYCGEEIMWQVGLGMDPKRFIELQRTNFELLEKEIEKLRFEKTLHYKNTLIQRLGIPSHEIRSVSPFHNQWWCNFYNDIKDPAWPATPALADFDALPDFIKKECYNTATSCGHHRVVPALSHLLHTG